MIRGNRWRAATGILHALAEAPVRERRVLHKKRTTIHHQFHRSSRVLIRGMGSGSSSRRDSEFRPICDEGENRIRTHRSHRQMVRNLLRLLETRFRNLRVEMYCSTARTVKGAR